MELEIEALELLPGTEGEEGLCVWTCSWTCAWTGVITIR